METGKTMKILTMLITLLLIKDYCMTELKSSSLSAKCCESCGKELTESQVDQNYLLNTPHLFCPRCYQIRNLIIEGPRSLMPNLTD